MIRPLYLIDGVLVPRRVYFRRMLYGEYSGANFLTVDRSVAKPKGPR